MSSKLVSFGAVFREVTQRSPETSFYDGAGWALRWDYSASTDVAWIWFLIKCQTWREFVLYSAPRCFFLGIPFFFPLKRKQHFNGLISNCKLRVKCGLSLFVLFIYSEFFSPGAPVFCSHQNPHLIWLNLVWFVIISLIRRALIGLA